MLSIRLLGPVVRPGFESCAAHAGHSGRNTRSLRAAGRVALSRLFVVSGDQNGKDRFEHHRQPCPCGGGSLVVEWTEHDTYGSSGMWETSVDCPTCSEEVTLAMQDGHVILVELREVKRRRELSDEAWRIDREIRNSPHGRELLRELGALLDRQPSVAAAHRVLSGADLTSRSIGSFRKDVKHRP